MEFVMLNRGYDCESSRVDSTVQDLSDEIGLIRKEQRKALKIILLNLYANQEKTIGVSRSNDKKLPRYKNPLHVGVKSIRTVLDRLNPRYVKQVIGDSAKRKTTTIKATDELRDYFDMSDWCPSAVDLRLNHEPVVLKDDSKKKNLVDYEETAFTSSVRQSLNQYMELLAKTCISYGKGEEYDKPVVTRIFNKCSFKRGGRIVGSWAHLASGKRKAILLNDEETVELDFPASTLNILYRYRTGNKSPHKEPYPVRVHGVKIPKKYCKKLITISMNVGNASTASRVFKQELSDTDLKEFDALGISTKELHRAIEDKHKVIYHNFFGGGDYGTWLQFIESELVFTILKKLTLEGIPSLTVYDSFIVRRGDACYVERLMDEMADSETMKIINAYPYEKLVGKTP